jgi:hypothetical protein
MTLGERLYRAAVATGAHPFAHPYAEAAKLWADLDEAQQARWEACAVIVDGASRADVVSQLHDIASRLDRDDGHDCAVRDAADRVEAGR